MITELDPDLPVFSVMTMRTHLSEGRAFMIIRLATMMVTAFGLLGATLAAVGLYGVVAYSVGQRGREFGIRMALGAESRTVLQLVVRHGLLLGAIGLAIGTFAAFAASRLTQSMLIGISATDPVTYATVGVGMLTIAVLASIIPAWRATRVDPMVALRDQ